MDYIFRWLGSKFLGAEYTTNEAGETMSASPDGGRPAAGPSVRQCDFRCAELLRVREYYDSQWELL